MFNTYMMCQFGLRNSRYPNLRFSIAGSIAIFCFTALLKRCCILSELACIMLSLQDFSLYLLVSCLHLHIGVDARALISLGMNVLFSAILHQSKNYVSMINRLLNISLQYSIKRLFIFALSMFTVIMLSCISKVTYLLVILADLQAL